MITLPVLPVQLTTDRTRIIRSDYVGDVLWTSFSFSLSLPSDPSSISNHYAQPSEPVQCVSMSTPFPSAQMPHSIGSMESQHSQLNYLQVTKVLCCSDKSGG